MLAEYKRKTNRGVLFGLLVQVAGRFLIIRGDPRLGDLLLLGGFILFIWGCGQYCKAKGHSAWLGLFGILSLFGLLILFFLTDKHKQGPVGR